MKEAEQVWKKRFCNIHFKYDRWYFIWFRHVYDIAARVARDDAGIVIGVVGLVVLLIMVLVRRKMDGKPAIVINGKAIGITFFGVVSTIIFGVGMCMTMIWNMMVPGIVVGMIGIVALLCLIPFVKGLKD